MKIKKLMSGLLAFAMATTMLTIPAFAAITASLSAPAITTDYTIDYAEEELTFVEANSGVSLFVGATSANAPTTTADETVAGWTSANFANVPTATPLSLTPGTDLKAYLVTTADPTVGTTAVTDYSATAGTITVPARSGTPAANLFTVVNNTNGTTDGTIKLAASGGEAKYETSIDSGLNWAALTSSGVTGLAKDATVDIRLKAVTAGGSEAFASAAVTLTMGEGAAAPALTKDMFELIDPTVPYSGVVAKADEVGTTTGTGVVKAKTGHASASDITTTNVEIIIKKGSTVVTTDKLDVGSYDVYAKGKVVVPAVFSAAEVKIATLVVTPAEITAVAFAKATLGTKKDYDGNNKFKAKLADADTTITGVAAGETLTIAVEGTLAVDKKLTVEKAELKDGTGKASNYKLATSLNLVTALTTTGSHQTPIVPTNPKLIKLKETISVSDGDAIPTVGDTLTLTLEGIGLIGNDELQLGRDYTVEWFVGGTTTSNTSNTYTIQAGNTAIIRAHLTKIAGSNYTFDPYTTDSVQVGKKTIPRPILKSSTGATINPYVDKLLPGDYTFEVPGLILGTDYAASAVAGSGQGGTVAGNILTIASGDAGKSVEMLLSGDLHAGNSDAGPCGTNRTFEYYTVANKPTAPTDVIVRSASGTLNLTLTGQTNGGSSPITVIEYSITSDGTTTDNVLADVVGERSVTIKNLVNGKEYTITNIKTKNAMGLSDDSFNGPITGTPQRSTGGGSYSGSSSSSNKSFIIDAKLPANATATSVKIGAEVPAEVTNVPSSATIVADTKPITAEMAKRAGGFGIKQALSINLFDGTTKITTVEGGKVKVTLPFAGTAGKQYVVLRYNADGTTSVIPATYADGNITFTTNRFGTDFAIAEVGGTTVVGGTTTGTTTGKVPQTGIVALAPLF